MILVPTTVSRKRDYFQINIPDIFPHLLTHSFSWRESEITDWGVHIEWMSGDNILKMTKESFSFLPSPTLTSVTQQRKWMCQLFQPKLQFSSVAQLCPTLCNPMNHSMSGIPVHQQLLEFTQTHVHWVSSCPQSFPASGSFQRSQLFSSGGQKYWSFSFSVSPSNEHPGLISFRVYWLDLLAVQGTLKSLLQYHSSKASILLHSAFFIVQLSHPYVTSGKTIALTRWTFVGKVMSLLLICCLGWS